jgi:hypothetical protein
VGGLDPAYVGKSDRELCQKTHPLRRGLLARVPARLSRNQGPSSITPTGADPQVETLTAFAPLMFGRRPEKADQTPWRAGNLYPDYFSGPGEAAARDLLDDFLERIHVAGVQPKDDMGGAGSRVTIGQGCQPDRGVSLDDRLKTHKLAVVIGLVIDDDVEAHAVARDGC